MTTLVVDAGPGRQGGKASRMRLCSPAAKCSNRGRAVLAARRSVALAAKSGMAQLTAPVDNGRADVGVWEVYEQALTRSSVARWVSRRWRAMTPGGCRDSRLGLRSRAQDSPQRSASSVTRDERAVEEKDTANEGVVDGFNLGFTPSGGSTEASSPKNHRCKLHSNVRGTYLCPLPLTTSCRRTDPTSPHWLGWLPVSLALR